MKILIAGVSAQTIAALEVIARAIWRDAALLRLSTNSRAATPAQALAAVQCRLCVVDLLGLGWSQWYPEHQARLELLLAGRAAVLLLPPNSGGGWFTTSEFSKTRGRVLLRRPASDVRIGEALRCAGKEVLRIDEATYQRHLSTNIWMQKQPARQLDCEKKCI